MKLNKLKEENTIFKLKSTGKVEKNIKSIERARKEIKVFNTAS